MSEIAQRFRRMADAIEKNDNFGGAFVIVPAEGAGDALETLILDGKPDAAQFWSMLKTKCDITLAEIELARRTNRTFGRG